MLTCVTPVTRGPRGPGIKQSTRLLAPDQSPLSLCSPPGHNGLTMAAQSWPRPPVVTPTPGSAPPSHVRRSSEFVGARRAFLVFNCREGGEERPPRSDLFVGRHGFCSSCFSLIVKFSFALNSLPLFFCAAFIFWAKTKKLNKGDQALNWITPTPNELLNVFLWFSSFQLEPGSQSLTLRIMWERGRGEWGPIKQLSSLLVN